MAWPTDTLVKTELDAGTDNPANARAQILAIANKLSEVIASLQSQLPGVAGAVNATHAELNKLDDSAAAVSGYVSGMREYLRTPTATAVALNLNALSKDTWTSVGPTGSGAGTIWADMDSIPAGAVGAIIQVRLRCRCLNSTFSHVDVSVSCRRTGDANGEIVAARQDFYGATISDIAGYFTTVVVPLDASSRFDTRWTAAASGTMDTLGLMLVGFIK